MDQGVLAVLIAVSAVALIGSVVVAVVSSRGRRRTRAELRASHAEIAALRRQVEELGRDVAGAADRHEDADREPRPPHPDYVITTLPDGTTRTDVEVAPVRENLPARSLSAGEFTSLAVGESLVRIVSFGHGVRRALSPENRHRIRYEMKREVKRSRKQRRRDVKEARRQLRADQQDYAQGTEDAA